MGSSTLEAVKTSLYVYGIIDAHDGLSFSMPGIEGGDIETVDANGISAVVSRVSRRSIRPQRSHLAAHNKLLHELVERQTVIPCAFGMIASSEEQLLEVLYANYDKLWQQLERFRGKVEMSLCVYWNTSNIFDFFVTTNEELRKMRDRVFQPGREPTMEDKIELGRLFESLLHHSREQHTQQVIESLKPFCSEILAVDPGQEQMIMKLVCLIPSNGQSRFEEGVQEAARHYDDRYCFKFNGPWAPFDFVDFTLTLPEG